MAAAGCPRRGEVWLVELPGWPAEARRRPALVVSTDVRNRLASDVIVVPVTTRIREMPAHVPLEAGEGGLDRPSMAKCEQITTVSKRYLVRGPLGAPIGQETMRRIETAIQIAVGILPWRAR